MSSDRNPFSASTLGRRYLCSGSYWLERDLPDDESDEAARGTKIHAAAAGDESVELEDDEQDVAERWREFCDSYFEGMETETEHPIAIYDFDLNAGEKLTDGTADIVGSQTTSDGSYVRVADLKSGWGNLSKEALSFQLSTYLAGYMQETGAAIGSGAVFQPTTGRTFELSLVKADLPEVIRSIRTVIERSKALPITLNPSEGACRFCKARGTCPATKAAGEELRDLTVNPRQGLTQVEQLNRSYALWKVVERYGEAVKKAVRDAAEQNMPGLAYKLQEARGRREITSAKGAFAAVKDTISGEEFTALAKVPLTKLEALWCEKRGGTNTEAKEELEARLNGVISRGATIKRLVSK